MSKKNNLAKIIKKVFLGNWKMDRYLYEYQLKEHLDEWDEILKEDKEDDFLLVVTEDEGDVAMVLVFPDKEIYINEKAIEELTTFWPEEVYKKNIKRFIPMIARNIADGYLAVLGVSILPLSSSSSSSGIGFGRHLRK